MASTAAGIGDISGAVATAPATRGTVVQATPTLPPPVPRVLWIGDSSLEGLKFYSQSQRAIGGMTYVLDAESCRRLVNPSCHSLAGNVPNTALEAIQGAAGPFDAVVVGTGYNEGSAGFSAAFDLIVAAARSKGAVRILWMNYRLRDGLTRRGTDNNPSYVANNATLLQKVASGAYPDVRHRRLARLHRAGAGLVRLRRHPLPTDGCPRCRRLHLPLDLEPVLGAVPATDDRRRPDRQAVHTARREPAAGCARPLRLRKHTP